MRAERSLRKLHKVFSHDLPNEMAAVQSLLQLLQLEEAERLSDQGREYLHRLQSATHRAGEMVCFLKELALGNHRIPIGEGRADESVRFLKELSRLSVFPCRTETIAFVALARAVQAELERLYPAREFVFAWRWDVPEWIGDAHVFLRAILELFAGLLHPQGLHCQVQGSARPLPDALELTFQIEETPAWASAGGLDEKMEIILAREWLALCGAEVEVIRGGAGGARFAITVPKR